ncbi:MAG: hypothetical protein ACPH5N_02470, partial [Pseudomonadales bacterium]
KSFENRSLSRIKILEELFSVSTLQCYPGPDFEGLNKQQKKRIATKPTKASKRRRVDAKTQKGQIKKLRGKPTV